MLRERPDLFNFGAEKIRKEVLPADRDAIVKARPRWKHIKGKKLPIFHASEANACSRRDCYAYRGDTPTPMDLDGALRVYDGDPHADSLVHWLTLMGYEVTDREKVFRKIVRGSTGRYGVTGRIDGIIQLPTNPSDMGSPREKYIAEFKGLSCFTHQRKDITEVVNKTYRMQAQVYMWMSGIHQTMFVIKNKNNSEFRFFEMDFNPKRIAQLKTRWAAVVSAVKEEALLPRDYTQSSLECKWCRHNQKCWG
jgi:hypothetical protein